MVERGQCCLRKDSRNKQLRRQNKIILELNQVNHPIYKKRGNGLADELRFGFVLPPDCLGKRRHPPNRRFARQPCCMAGTMKMFCIRKNIFCHRKKTLFSLPCNMVAVQNLYRLERTHWKNPSTTMLSIVFRANLSPQDMPYFAAFSFRTNCGKLQINTLRCQNLVIFIQRGQR